MIAFDAIQIFLFLLAVPVLLRLRLDKVDALVSRPVRQQVSSPVRIIRTKRMIDLMIRWGRPLVVPGCLTRGLALYYFLRRLGVNVALVFGTGKVNDTFAAHCWLERNHEPYLEKVDPGGYFVPIYRFGNLM